MIPIKLIIWDLDETFWTGTLSEGTVIYNEYHHDLIIELSKRGIINSICSKNDFDSAKTLLCSKGIWEYFVFPNIDWQPKGQVITRIIQDMKLRAENVLFIDDNPSNLAEVQYYSPGIQTATPNIISQLLKLDALKGNSDPSFSRLMQYKILEQKLEAKNTSGGNNEEFLRGCNIEVTFIEDCLAHSTRILDLINRSNQLNFTKKRLTQEELNCLLNDNIIETVALSVVDQYGDYGICGFYAKKGNQLLHFIFSCRILDMGIEKWLYNRLGNPSVDIIGEVATSLVGAHTPDWIAVTSTPKVMDNRHEAMSIQNRVIIKGGCDLEQLSVYMGDSYLIETEFNYVSDKGFPIHTEHSEILRQCIPETIDKYGYIIDRLPFLDRSAFNTSFFSIKWDTCVYSVLMDVTQGLYRYRDTDFIVPFGDFLVDITLENNWGRYIDKYVDKGITRDFFNWFSKNFHFLGVLSLSQFETNFRWIRSMVEGQKQLVIINAAEVKFPHATEIGRWQHHKKYNEIIDKLEKESNCTAICDVRKIVTNFTDVTDTIRHYTRQKYFEIAEELKLVLSQIDNGKTTEKMKTLHFQILNLPNQQFEKTRYLYSVSSSKDDVQLVDTNDYESYVKHCLERGFTKVKYRQKEINRALIKVFNSIQQVRIDGVSFPEFLSHDRISMWQFIMPAVYNGPSKEVFEIIEYLSTLIEEHHPESVVISGNFIGYQEKTVCEILRHYSLASQFNKIEFLNQTDTEDIKESITDDFHAQIESGNRLAIGAYAAHLQKNLQKYSDREKLLMASFPSAWRTTLDGEIDRYYDAFDTEMATNDFEGVRLEVPYYFLIKGSKKRYIESVVSDKRGRFNSIFFDSYADDVFDKSAEWYSIFTVKYEQLLSNSDFRGAFSWKGFSFLEPLRDYWRHLFTKHLSDDAVPSLYIARRLLAELKPKALLLVYEGGVYCRALTIEAHRSGIPSFALQHGEISDQFKSYMDENISCSPDLTAGYYGFIVPSVTFVWGEHHRILLTRFGNYPANSVVSVGNWMATNTELFLASITHEKLSALRTSWFRSDKKIALLLTAVSAFGILDEIASKIDRNEYCVLIKPHPQENNGPHYYRYFTDCGFETALINDFLYEAIFLADIIIVDIFSTTVCDSLPFNKTVFTYQDREPGWTPSWQHLVFDMHREQKLTHKTLTTEMKHHINVFLEGYGLLVSKEAASRKVVENLPGNVFASQRKGASDINNSKSIKPIKLYAGDVPAMPEYDGWIGLSLTQNNDRHIQHDITNTLPFPNDSVDAFQSEDVIEHIQYDLLVPVINEIYRILKPGALFRLSVPDYGCDVLRDRSAKDASGNIVFDPGGGGTPKDPGHLWFPRVENLYRLLEKTKFYTEGSIEFLHYWNMTSPTFVTKPIDYSKGIVRRTPDFDDRVKTPYRPMSLVVDLIKIPSKK